MADEIGVRINDLPSAAEITDSDYFVLQQSNIAKNLPGGTLIQWLVNRLEAHGGITSITGPDTSGLTDTYTINFVDGTTQSYTVTNGRGISSISSSKTGDATTLTINYNDDSTPTSFTVNDGAKGDVGQQTYVHIKYSEISPTSDDQMHDRPTDDDVYIGFATTTNEQKPTFYTAYTWFKFRGLQGEASYVHVKYASEQPTSEDIPIFDTPNTWMGIVVTTDPDAPTSYSDYQWIKIAGLDGASTYVHIKYSHLQPDSDFDMQDEPAEWFGILVDKNPEASISYSDYAWYRIRGYNNYVWIKYAEQEPSEQYPQITDEPNAWLGTYVGTSEEAPTSYTEYQWQKIVGDSGTNNYVWIKYAPEEPNASTALSDTTDNWIGIYNGNESSPPESYTSYQWQRLHGIDGVDGKDVEVTSSDVTYGTSYFATQQPLDWTTEIPTVEPGSYLWTKLHLVYTNDTESFILINTRYGVNGTDGTPGEDGADGISPTLDSTSVMYASADNALTPPSEGWTSSPSAVIGEFLWTRTTIQFSVGDPITYYSVGRVGRDGQSSSVLSVNGQTGADTEGEVTLTGSDIKVSESSEDTIEQALQNISPVNANLLINPAFTINQRGNTSYGSSSGVEDNRTYTVDCWKVRYGQAELVTNGLKITGNQNTSLSAYCIQTIEFYDQLLGKDVTASFKISDIQNLSGNALLHLGVASGSGNFYATSMLGELTLNSSNASSGTYTVTFTMPQTLPNQYLNFIVYCEKPQGLNVSYILEYAKLELGNISTIALDSINYQVEYLKCLRYFYRLNGGASISLPASTARGANNLYPTIQLPIPMRVIPTVSWGGTETVLGDMLRISNSTTFDESFPVTSFTHNARTKSSVNLNLRTSGLTAGLAYMVFIKDKNYLDFDTSL